LDNAAERKAQQEGNVMLRHPMELETLAAAKMDDLKAMSLRPQLKSPSPKQGGILGHARHAIGMALIVSGDLIAGDTAVQERAHSKEHASRPLSA
jgi:hypothetical protein